MERDIFMKKAALFLTILCLVLFTVGCTSGSSTSRESYDTTGTVYSSQNTEDDDKDDEPKPMASATQTPEPDICSVCNDEGYLDCEVCGHMGYTECDLCSGEGQRICPTCDGSQYRICGACDGAGGKKCISCNGTGIFGDEYTLIRGKCMMCGGSGTAQCAYCGGAGKEPCVCTGSGLIQCKNCHGDGGFLCTACQGEGRILCTNCQKKTEQPSGQTPGGGTGGNTGGGEKKGREREGGGEKRERKKKKRKKERKKGEEKEETPVEPDGMTMALTKTLFPIRIRTAPIVWAERENAKCAEEAVRSNAWKTHPIMAARIWEASGFWRNAAGAAEEAIPPVCTVTVNKETSL